jgi:Fe2+ transport system protein FeoA
LSRLSELNVGESGVLVALELPESVQNHLMHMGFVPDALVTVLRRAPAGDPTVYGVDGMEIALRHETAEAIRMREPETDGAIDSEAHRFHDSDASERIEAER